MIFKFYIESAAALLLFWLQPFFLLQALPWRNHTLHLLLTALLTLDSRCAKLFKRELNIGVALGTAFIVHQITILLTESVRFLLGHSSVVSKVNFISNH